MGALEIAVIVLAAAVPVSMLAVGAAMWFITRQNQQYTLAAFDRFLSRNMSEYGMTDMIKKEIEADQDEDQGEEAEEDQIFEKYMVERLKAEGTLGGPVS